MDILLKPSCQPDSLRSISQNRHSKNGKPVKNGHDRVLRHPLRYLVPCEENNAIYNNIRDDDPATIALAESIEKQSILEPIVVTRDFVVISGHCKSTAAKLAGLSSIPRSGVDSLMTGDDYD